MSGETNKPAGEEFDFDTLMGLDNGKLAQLASGGSNANEEGEVVTPPAQPAAAAPAPEDKGGQPSPAGAVGSGESTPPQTGAVDPDDDAWMASLPPDAQEHVRKMRQAQEEALRQSEDRYKALHGRVAPLQRRLSEVETSLATRPAPQAPATPATPVNPDTADSFFDSDTWKDYAEKYPGDAKVLREGFQAQSRAQQDRIAQLDARLGQLAQRLESTEQVTSRGQLQTEMEKLEAAHPDWRDLNQSQEFWSWFEDWRAGQPKSMRSIYYDQEQLPKLLEDSEFTINLLNGFKASRAPVATPVVPAASAPATPQTESTQQPAAPAPSNVRMEMGVAPQVRGGSPVPHAVDLNGMTEAEQFEHLWKQAHAQ